MNATFYRIMYLSRLLFTYIYLHYIPLNFLKKWLPIINVPLFSFRILYIYRNLNLFLECSSATYRRPTILCPPPRPPILQTDPHNQPPPSENKTFLEELRKITESWQLKHSILIYYSYVKKKTKIWAEQNDIYL